ncbi:cobalamin biosynthesis protein CobY [Croceicoccus naphthovorans]|uniref:Cobalamin biosynthesis protein CobY n=2 Tax=Croceicoccus naphthovorans TaxID=1348774 RepID=A0A0G3XLY9_9SPHN|nr:cobalamin biosynthesis protein CobY [Croceicoccus naphthovorans]
MTALILAGSRPEGEPFALAQGYRHKALIEIEGKPMLSWVCEALRNAGFARVVVTSNVDEILKLAGQAGAETMPAESGPSASVAAAFERFGAPMLVTTSDHPLLRADWVRDFVADTPETCDLSILLANRDTVEAAVPDGKRTWIRMADGHWSGCNLFLLKTAAARRAIDLWGTVEANRKRPLRIAMQLGVGTLLRFVLGRLTMQQVAGRLGLRVGVDARVVAARDGLAAVDVDKEADLVLVRSIMAGRGG